MQAQQHPLWQKLRRYEFGNSEARERFTARLARDQAWSLPYAERVVDEYLRFMFLGCVGDAPICPSEEVDRAWHLHLTHTREYWGAFCGEVLEKPFHHTPSAGNDEREKHVAMYEATLAAYAKWFGHRPPTDIWPGADRRFAYEAAQKPRSTARSRPSDESQPDAATSGGTLPWWGAILATMACVVAAVHLVHGSLISPLDLTGREFLTLYAICFFPAVVFGIVVRVATRHPKVEFGTELPKLGGYETAYLGHGASGVCYATIAALVRRGSLTFDAKRRQLNVGIVPPPGDPISAQVIKSVDADRSLRGIAADLQPAVEAIRDELTKLGLLVPEALRRRVRLTAVLPIAMLLLLGLAKIGVGMAREKPVSFLVIGSIAATIATLCVGGIPFERSERGSRALEAMRHAERANEHAAFATESNVGHSGLVAAFGLFGLSALHGTPTGPLRGYIPMFGNGNTGNGNNGGGFGCGGTGSGCGGGGCGGGGGGCGGCS